MVMNRGAAPVPVFRSREPGAHHVANLNPRSLASLVTCDGGWCHIKADGVSGWARANQLWGTEQTPQCR
jgi:SH3-like domain-containing protein